MPLSIHHHTLYCAHYRSPYDSCHNITDPIVYAVPFIFPWLINSITGSLYLWLHFTHFIYHLPSGRHLFIFCMYRSDSVLYLFICVGIFFFRFHTWVKSYITCFSQSDLFNLAWCPLDPSMLSQMARAHPFSWLNNILLFINARTSLFIHPLTDI